MLTMPRFPLLLFIIFFLAPLTHAGSTDWAPMVLDGSLFSPDGASETPIDELPGNEVDENTIRLSGANVKLGRLKFGEMLVKREEDGAVQNLRLMIYNKGDDGPIDKALFTEKRQTAVAALDQLTGVKGQSVNVGTTNSGVKVKTIIWKTEHALFRMEYLATTKGGFKAEFIRLDIGPDKESITHGGSHDAASKVSLKSNVKHKEDGTTWIDGIPMADQGQKGYCAPATLSRIFAYYGMDGVDQHALAALCHSSGRNGTSVDDLVDAMKRISGKFHIRITTLEDYAKIVLGICDPYNKIARKQDQPFISAYDEDMYAEIDPDILREVRAGKPAAVNKWLRGIRKSIDAGIPVLWCVELGLYPEEDDDYLPSMPREPHMRMIIGYNLEAQTIIFSDSWGAGHEHKVIDAADACSMTLGLYILKPSK